MKVILTDIGIDNNDPSSFAKSYIPSVHEHGDEVAVEQDGDVLGQRGTAEARTRNVMNRVEPLLLAAVAVVDDNGDLVSRERKPHRNLFRPFVRQSDLLIPGSRRENLLSHRHEANRVGVRNVGVHEDLQRRAARASSYPGSLYETNCLGGGTSPPLALNRMNFSQ